MSDIKALLEIRRRIKKKNPHFIRQNATNIKKLGDKWRKPKGMHSKVRQKIIGHEKLVSKGYGGPKAVRNLHKSGLRRKIANALKDIENARKDNEGIIIAKSVGRKKRIEMLKKAKELGIEVLNIRNIDDYLKNAEKAMEEKKASREKSVEKGKKAGKNKYEKLVEKLQSEKGKKEEEKKEKDKLLTKRA